MNDEQKYIVGQALKMTRFATRQLFGPSESVCIISSRVLIDSLRSFGIKAGPRPAKLDIYNPAFLKAQEAGIDEQDMDPEKCHVVHVGYGPNPNRWAGHLVAVAEVAGEEFVLDAALDCYSRPQYEMELEAAAFRINEAVWVSEGLFAAKLNECLLIYRPDVGNEAYRKSVDWTRRRKYRPITEAVVALIDNQLKARAKSGQES